MCRRKEISNKPVVRRVNSIVFRSKCNFVFRKHEEVVSFLKQNLKRSEIEGIYFDENLKNFVVKLTDNSAYDNCVGNVYQYKQSNGSTLELVAVKANDFVHCVKLFNVPYEVSNDMVVQVIGKYGNIQEIYNDTVGEGKWKIPNGNRTVYMEVNGKLPVSLDIAGLKVKVFSTSFTKICFLCGGNDHLINGCRKERSHHEEDELKDFATDASDSRVTVQNKNRSSSDCGSVGDHDSFVNTLLSTSSGVSNVEDNGRVLMIERADTDKSTKTVSNFVLNGCIKKIIDGEPKKMRRLENGNVLVETMNDRQADLLVKATDMNQGINIRVHELTKDEVQSLMLEEKLSKRYKT